MNLDHFSDAYNFTPPYSQEKKDIILSIYQENIIVTENSRVLQMGIGGGYETKRLRQIFDKFDAIDGSLKLIEKYRNLEECRGINFVHCNFEDYTSISRYDYIFCTYIFEHVEDTVLLLKHIQQNLLSEHGKVFIVVPNCDALSRRIAVEMGALKSLIELTPNDLKHGHRRVYSIETLMEDLRAGGFKVDFITGIVFKILADFQLNELLTSQFLTSDHIRALQRLAEKKENLKFSDSILVIVSSTHEEMQTGTGIVSGGSILHS
jgi:2-polyprenyl-3-methyl-5-hydroxy-6-metoxy-1,4-benzoquinol methylase